MGKNRTRTTVMLRYIGIFIAMLIVSTICTASAAGITLTSPIKIPSFFTYTVTYNGNGSTGGAAPTDSNTYAQGATVTVLGNTGNLVHTGYVFAGWNTAVGGSGTSYQQGATFTMGTANVNLYAQWTLFHIIPIKIPGLGGAIPTTYTVTYWGNGATGGMYPTDSNTYAQGATVTVLGNTGNLVNTGYVFAGWNTAVGGSGTSYQQGATFTMGTANVNLYAQWTTAPTTPAPTVASVSPSNGPAAGGTTVTITGSGFTGATAVTFGSTTASFSFVNDSTITATSPAGSGVVDVTVITPGGTSATSPSDQFTYAATPAPTTTSAPAVTGVSPNSGPAAGGTQVTISGSGFTGATAVNFGSSAATGGTVNSDTSITATSPAGSAGAVDVTVVTPGGTSATSSNDQFTYATTTTTTPPTTGQTVLQFSIGSTDYNVNGQVQSMDTAPMISDGGRCCRSGTWPPHSVPRLTGMQRSRWSQ